MALDTFKAAQWAKNPDTENVATTKVELEEWREHFRRQHTGNTDKSKDAVFSRNRQDFVNKGYLTVESNIYSLGNMTTFRKHVARNSPILGNTTQHTPLGVL